MAEIVVKTDPSDALDLETRILILCQENPAGVTDKILRDGIPTSDIDQRVIALNRLLSQGKLEIMRQGKQLLYRLKDPDAVSKVKGADAEEKVVYQIIEEAGNKGIWIRDIRYKSNLLLTQVNKVLKNLESRKLIKAVKSVAASKKKVYMLYNLEPDRSVTGGAWYSDQDFESEFVEVLSQQCYKFLQQKAAVAKEKMTDPMSQRYASHVSSQDLRKYIQELGISKVELSLDDIESILNTLVYDGRVEYTVLAAASSSSKDSGMTKMYYAIEPLVQKTGLMQVPCGVCPVRQDCHEGGIISPLTCVYFKEWLEY